MSVVIPAPPVALPVCEPTMGGRSFASGVRTGAVAVSDSAEVMRSNASPADWSGDASEVATHTMTSTASDLEGVAAALTHGAAAADRFLDRLEKLIRRHDDLAERRQHLALQQVSFAQRAAEYDVETEEAGLKKEAAVLSRRISRFDDDVATWQSDLTSTEDAFIASLQRADTVAEGDDLAASAPDVAALRREMAKHKDDPEAMHAWWASLSRREREALKTSDPGRVGNTDGIPVADRDEANRAQMSALWNTLQQRKTDGELTDDEKDQIKKLQEVYGSLDLTEVVTDPATGEDVESFLMVFSPDGNFGDGAVAVAYGNPETADHTSVNVPGFGSRMDNFSDPAGDALNVFESASSQGNGSVSSIAWLDYNAPDPELRDPFQIIDMTNVTNEASAHFGAKRLSDFIDGLRATDQGDQSHLTAIGHSYGSTTVAKASGDGLDVDDTVLVGSPGAGAGNDHADDMSGRVWVGAADNDFVSHLGNPTMGGLGNDPSADGFGGTRFRVDDQEGFSLTPGGVKDGIENHTSYFDDQQDLSDEGRDASQDSQSLQNLGRIVSGNTDDVDVVDGRDENSAQWLAREGAETTAEQAVEIGVDAYVRGRDLLEHAPRLYHPLFRW